MSRFWLVPLVAGTLWMSSLPMHSQQNPEWLAKEFSVEPSQTRDVESFLNGTCRTSGLEGIQLVAVQSGHGQPMHLHVYCRHDNSESSHFTVSMIPIPDRNPDKAITPVLHNPNVRVGPFYFGNEGAPDGVLIVEKHL